MYEAEAQARKVEAGHAYGEGYPKEVEAILPQAQRAPRARDHDGKALNVSGRHVPPRPAQSAGLGRLQAALRVVGISDLPSDHLAPPTARSHGPGLEAPGLG